MSTSSRKGPQRLGKYELREKLGQGSAAEVWKAFDTELQRSVAIKLLHPNMRTDPQFITRFSREARLIAALHHPNIIQIHDFQTDRQSSDSQDTPIAYMVMDYVEGETLDQYIHRTSRAGKWPSPTEIVYLFASIGKALDYAHREGMIHRDIKPANILLDKRHAAPNSIGEPVLTDFGIAKIVGASSDTMTGMWLGTPLYTAPEQAQSYPATKQSDIYSLGVILYEICTGVYPFFSESVTTVLMLHMSSAPPPPDLINPAIPPALAAAILCALEKDPAERFRSASALAAAVAEAFHLYLPTGPLLPTRPLTDLLEPTTFPTTLSPSSMPSEKQQSQSPPVMDSSPQTPHPTLTTPQFTQPAAGKASSPVVPTSNTPTLPSQTPAAENSQGTTRSPVSAVKLSPKSLFLHTARHWESRKGNLIAWIVVLFVLAGSVIVSLNALSSGHANPASTTAKTVGTLAFTDSGQYDPNTTVGYNDIVTLSLHSLTTPQTGMAYFVWLMPDEGDDTTVPLLLGRLSVNGGNATFQYASPTYTNLLAQYSGVRITEQPASDNPSTPSEDPNTWRWEGWVPHTPTPGDAHQYSLLSHLRHLLAKDPTLQANNIPGGLVIWLTRNVAKVEEWSSGAQGQWSQTMSDGDADLIHGQLIRMLDYLDGQSYVGLDVPAGSPWLVDPLAGKLGLLSYTQDQQPPGYLQHVDTHMNGLVASPGHTEEQKQVSIQVDSAIARMIKDLTIVRKDAVQLVQRNNDQLRQPDTLTLLNEMATLTTEANSGWLDGTTRENVGGAIWLNARIQQLATISLTVSNQP